MTRGTHNAARDARCAAPGRYALWSFRLYEALAYDCIPVLFDEECAPAAQRRQHPVAS